MANKEEFERLKVAHEVLVSYADELLCALKEANKQLEVLDILKASFKKGVLKFSDLDSLETEEFYKVKEWLEDGTTNF